MKKSIFAIGVLYLSVTLASARPNIIFMLVDDQGWNGTSVAMHPEISFSKHDFIDTPYLEELASEGMRFSAAYAPASVCSPTRCSLQLGMSTASTGWTKAGLSMTADRGYRLIPPPTEKSLDPATITIAETLREAGYTTAHFGKWHLQGGGPGEHGYDEHDGSTGNQEAHRFESPNPADVFGMAARAEQLMERASREGNPFFIQLSWYPLHGGQNALPDTLKKYGEVVGESKGQAAELAAIAENLDAAVGRIMTSLDRLGIAENTYVIYMSDNGGGGKGNLLRGGKGGLGEGGIRSPLIVRGPGVAPNSWCHTRVVGYDFFPTFCEWAGVPIHQIPKGLEGGSLASVLANRGEGTVNRARREMVFHFPHYQNADGPHSAIMMGDYKLLKFYEGNRSELYDLSVDIREQNNLASEKPGIASSMNRLLEEYLAQVNARLPIPNPQFDPENVPGPQQKLSGKKKKK